MKLFPLLILLISCGKSDSKLEPCKPQEIGIDECVVKKFENWPNEYLIESYKDESNRSIH